MNRAETNMAALLGIIVSDMGVSHRTYGEEFYRFQLSCRRKSGYEDVINVIVSDRLLFDCPLCVGDRVSLRGQVRTYNSIENGKSRLNVVVFAKEIWFAQEDDTQDNRIYLEGFICREPVKRTSPLGRQICDLMVAVNRRYNKSDYIPCIAWGRNAGYGGSLEVGTKIAIEGRIQSREYNKKDEEGNVTVKTAYEVSITRIEKIDATL